VRCIALYWAFCGQAKANMSLGLGWDLDGLDRIDVWRYRSPMIFPDSRTCGKAIVSANYMFLACQTKRSSSVKKSYHDLTSTSYLRDRDRCESLDVRQSA